MSSILATEFGASSLYFGQGITQIEGISQIKSFQAYHNEDGMIYDSLDNSKKDTTVSRNH